MTQVALEGEVLSSSGRSLMTGTSSVCITATVMPHEGEYGDDTAYAARCGLLVGRRLGHDGASGGGMRSAAAAGYVWHKPVSPGDYSSGLR